MMSSLPFEFAEKLNEFEAALLNKHPSMPGLLKEIHGALKKQPANVTLLSEEQVCIIVQGLEKQTNIFLADAVAKKSKSSTASKSLASKLSKISDDEF